MAKIIELPKLSPTMEEGTLVRWTRHVGDTVAIDDLLAEVETDKATMEFRAFDKGTVLALLVEEGAVAKLGAPVAILGNAGEDITALLASVKGGAAPAANAPAEPAAPKDPTPEVPEPTQTPEVPAPKSPTPESPAPETPAPEIPTPNTPSLEAPAPNTPSPEVPAPKQAPEVPAPVQTPPPVAAPAVVPAASTSAHGVTGVAGAILAPTTPRVRRLAREQVVDVATVPGSGDHGRVLENDLAAATTAKAPVAQPPASNGAADTTRIPSPTRKTIARRLTESWQTVPHFYLEADLDVGALIALREQLNEGATPETKVSVNDFFLKASAVALREVPESNASWVNGQIIEHHRVDISMAVAIDDGLVTPVLRDVDVLSIRVIASRARDLASRARARKLKPEEMSNGVFSVSNLGMFQIDRFAAVINPPEGMILAVGAARDVPVVRDGAVVPGKRCAVTLSCDHRVVDGALGARFLLALRTLVEHPLRIL